MPDARSAHFSGVSSPLCVCSVCDSIGSLGRSSLINLALWTDTNLYERLLSGMLPCLIVDIKFYSTGLSILTVSKMVL